MTSSTPVALPPNHHAGHAGFAGLTGLAAGLSMIPGRGAVARLAADLTSVSPSDHVVDLGCGPGVAAREAARRGARVTGVDPAPVMLRLASRLTRSTSAITWSEGSAEAIPLADDAATVLWSVATVHHWRDLDAGLREVDRVLAAGGRFLVIERRTRPGATGHASHGWTDEQAAGFAERCRDMGFVAVQVARHAGRRPLLTVQAHAS
jgi:ubiquinone/menaquinone biosynthesis C-methylase UbiE